MPLGELPTWEGHLSETDVEGKSKRSETQKGRRTDEVAVVVVVVEVVVVAVVVVVVVVVCV